MKRHSIQHHKESGSVLVAVVLVLTLVSFWVLGFTKQTLSLQRESSTQLDRKRAYQAALAGVEYSLLLLETQKIETLDGGHCLPESEFRFQVRNEEGKWDLNSLIDGDGNLREDQEKGVARFLELVGLKESQSQIIHKMADWIDVDNDPREFGAESHQYSGYQCRNSSFESLSEWLLVLDRDEQKAKRLREGCTVFSSGKINLNTAPAVVLGSLSEQMTETVVKQILSYRSRGSFDSGEKLKQLQGITDAIYHDIEDKLIFEGTYYSIWVEGKSRDQRVQVGAVVKREEGQFKRVWFKRDLKNEDFLAWN